MTATRLPSSAGAVAMPERAAVEEGEWGDKAYLLTLDGRRVTSGSFAEMTDAASRINAILEKDPA